MRANTRLPHLCLLLWIYKKWTRQIIITTGNSKSNVNDERQRQLLFGLFDDGKRACACDFFAILNGRNNSNWSKKRKREEKYIDKSKNPFIANSFVWMNWKKKCVFNMRNFVFFSSSGLNVRKKRETKWFLQVWASRQRILKRGDSNLRHSGKRAKQLNGEKKEFSRGN